MKTLSGLSYKTKQVNQATSALFALDWSPQLVTALGQDRLIRLCTRLKISKLSRTDYASLIRLVNLPTPDPSAMFPFSMESWRALLVRFGLEDIAPFPDWLTTLYELRNLLIDTPEQLATLSYESAHSLFERVPSDLPLCDYGNQLALLAGPTDGGQLLGN